MIAVLFDAPDIYASAAILLDQGFATPVAAEAGLDHLPAVVPNAAIDPPERIPGALDVEVATVSATRGFDWNSPGVAAVVLILGTAPLLRFRTGRQRGRPVREPPRPPARTRASGRRRTRGGQHDEMRTVEPIASREAP
jgi:hypothetical protein